MMTGMIPLEAIRKAAAALEGIALKTPLVYSTYFSEQKGVPVYLKLENLQKTGSFKFRGACYKISSLRDQIGPAGVVAASAGNHAQGVAQAARLMGVSATVVMPEWSSIGKQLATRSYGARVLLQGKNVSESLSHARDLEKNEGFVFVHPFDEEDVIAGQGTVGLEILSELPDVDTLVVPVGGGGLIAGVATAAKSIKKDVRIIGVQASACASALAAIHAGRPVTVPVQRSLADGILVKEVGKLPYQIMARLVDDIVTVDEEQIAASILDLLERKRVLAEGAGAVPLAALMGDRFSVYPGKPVVLVISGGNVDSHVLGRILYQGLYRTGRILRFYVQLEDVPGALAGLLKQVASRRCNVLHIHHDRMGRNLPVGLTRVELEVETRDRAHGDELLDVLSTSGYQVTEH